MRKARKDHLRRWSLFALSLANCAGKSRFTPSTRMERIPGVLSGYMDSTLLTMLQTAAYVAPGMFEQGAA